MASIPFHSKNDFEVACYSLPADIMGFKDYMSMLMYKKI
jgi:hypothetical protein